MRFGFVRQRFLTSSFTREASYRLKYSTTASILHAIAFHTVRRRSLHATWKADALPAYPEMDIHVAKVSNAMSDLARLGTYDLGATDGEPNRYEMCILFLPFPDY